jgi:hypothetical protein
MQVSRQNNGLKEIWDGEIDARRADDGAGDWADIFGNGDDRVRH